MIVDVPPQASPRTRWVDGGRPHNRSRLVYCTPRAAPCLATRLRRGLLLVLLALLLVHGVVGSMTFTTTNVVQPSRYQTVQIALSSSPSAGDVPIVRDDLVYLVPDDAGSATSCAYDPTGTTTYTVTATSSVTTSGTVVVPITPGTLPAATRYALCYLSLARRQAVLVRRLSPAAGETDLVVWPSIYSALTLTPSTPAGGQGPVTVAVTQNRQSGRPSNTGLVNGYTIFLVRCGVAGSDCASVDTLVTGCAAVGANVFRDGVNPMEGVITVQNLRGQGGDTLNGSFDVPYAASSVNYFVCIPYCGFSDGATSLCGGGGATSSVPMSYAALVRSTGDATITFAAANPSSYTRTPTSPQAHEFGTMYFRGTDLTAQDLVKVIREDQDCASSSAVLLPNLQLDPLQWVSSTQTTVGFVMTSLVSSRVRGRVCYQRGGTARAEPWAAVYGDGGGSAAADFTIDVLQPTSFDVTPAQPGVGETFTLSFIGTGLDGATDAAFLTTATTCTTTTDDATFTCALGAGTTPQCTLHVDPDTNGAMTLTVCYRKASRTSFAALRGRVALTARNPVYTLTPYPVFAGQSVTVHFTGTDLSEGDQIVLLHTPAGTAVSCEGGTPTTSATLTPRRTEVPGAAYSYYLVAHPDACLTVCYRRASSSGGWVVARDGTQGRPALVETCGAAHVYVAPLPLRYTFAALAGAVVTARETTTLRFDAVTPVSTALAAFTAAPLGVKLVRAADACALGPCAGTSVAGCRQSAAASDFAGAVSETTRESVVMAATTSHYLVCVVVQAAGTETAYVPLLPSVGTGYGFTPSQANPTLQGRFPSTWRVGMVNVNTTYTGTALDASTDRVYALPARAMGSVGTALVCPVPGSTPRTTVRSRLSDAESTTTRTVVHHSRLAALTTGEVVYVCYEWGSATGVRRMSYVDAVVMAAAVPNALEWVLPSLDSSSSTVVGLHAGDGYTLRFYSNVTASLSADADAFYVFAFAATRNPGCYCYPDDCARGTRASGGGNFVPSMSTDQRTTYENALGFDNYGMNAYYVLCYGAAALAGVDTYVGEVAVSMANPAYYLDTAVAGMDRVRVGSPVQVTAYALCVNVQPDCAALSEQDVMRLVAEGDRCAAVSPSSSSSSEGVVTRVGSPVVGMGGTSYTQRFALAQAGRYRVCYHRVDSAAGLNELVYDVSFTRQLVTVAVADPVAYTTVPSAPSAGQVVRVDLDCSTTRCTSCVAVRLVPGVDAGCWDDVANTLRSQACLTVTSVEFADDVVVGEGDYTVCYGEDVQTASWVPGTLHVTGPNPSRYGPVSGQDSRVSTNQMTDFVLDIDGDGLSVDDDAFLLPALGHTCHDLRTSAIAGNNTLASWLAPCITPYPLQRTSTGVRWVVSNRSKLFGLGLLAESGLCGSGGTTCTMQLCYRRSGTSWAVVPLASGQAAVQLVISNPASVAFAEAELRVGMYTLVHVTGASLQANYRLAIHAVTCDGTALTRQVGTGVVNAAGTVWSGVVRVLGTASSYAVCFWRNGVATEVLVVSFAGASRAAVVIQPPLYILPYRDNVTAAGWTRYAQLMVGVTLRSGSALDVQAPSSMQLIVANTTEAECNYIPFAPATGFATVATLTAMTPDPRYFHTRLTMPAGDYALCVNITGVGLFRVVDDADALVIRPANPSNYDPFPTRPMPGQQLRLRFTTSDTAATTFDTVELLDGTLYDCGFHNTTTVMAANVTVVQGTTAEAWVRVPNDVDAAYVDGRALLVCYHAAGHTAAVVPRDDVVQAALRLTARRPTRWDSSPRQVERDVPVRLTFAGLAAETDYFTTSDVAFVVPYSATGTDDAVCDATRAVATSTGMTLDGGNAVWSVPAYTLRTTGDYAVCYNASRNGVPVYVDTAPWVRVYAQQSPYAVHTQSVDGSDLSVFSGERVYLRFDSDTVLQPRLDSGGGGGDTSEDLVRITTDLTCTTALDAGDVVEVPSSMGYRPLQLVNRTTGLPVPTLHLRFRAQPGRYYVCLRRAGRVVGEVFYDFDVVGTVNSPGVLRVSEAPIASFATTPSAPRVWVPGTTLQLRFATGLDPSSFTQLFFVPSPSTTPTLTQDDCYRPTPSDALDPSSTRLVNTTLQVDLTTLTTTLPFPRPGDFVLCYQPRSSASGAMASVAGGGVMVLNPSPVSYSVPTVVGTQTRFSLGFVALDGIFVAGQAHRAQLYGVSSMTQLPSDTAPPCTGVAPPVGGVTSFTSFAASGATTATVQPVVENKGYYYVCFLTAGQSAYFAVPNVAGGYVFAVGLSGAQQYTVQPTPPRMGQELHLTIRGNNLASTDRAKLVGLDAAPSTTTDYTALCTDTATNADASEVSGAAGTAVRVTNPLLAHYYPIVNASGGAYILCYRSTLDAGVWRWVSEVAYFTVGAAHPTSYAVTPTPTFAKQVARVTIGDTDAVLRDTDTVKLVARGNAGSRNGFDCTRDAPASTMVSVVARDATTGSTLGLRVCGTAATAVTLCYALDGSESWAEVPWRVGASSYVFAPLELRSSVFTGPRVLSGATPRPYETVRFDFASAETGLTVRQVRFATASAAVACALTVNYITPLYYERLSDTNTFVVALRAPGDYRLYLGTTDDAGAALLLHDTPLTIGLCDPCGVSPPYTTLPLTTATVALHFVSRLGNTLSDRDRVRLVAYDQGVEGAPCAAPTGAFATLTLRPSSVGAGGASATYALPINATVPVTDYLGSYHVCYAKGDDGDYAVVADTAGVAAVFAVYGEGVWRVTGCPSGDALVAMETVVYNVTLSNPTLYPRAAFDPDDQLALVATSALPSSCVGFDPATQHAQWATLESYTTTQENWYLTLAPGVTDYVVCYRGAHDVVFRAVGTQTVGMADPVGFYTAPPVVLPSSVGVTVTITGTALSPRDDVVLVAASESCVETCARAVYPTPWTGVDYTTRYVDAATVRIAFATAVGTEVSLGVCYRRAGAFLTRLGDFHVGEPNPINYTVDFVPRVGTRPTLRFRGTALTTHDAVVLVALNTNCAPGNAVAVGRLLDVDSTGQAWSRFTLALTGLTPETDYVVCYRVDPGTGYSAVNPVFHVSAGGPTRLTRSNVVMRGRATQLGFVETTTFVVRTGDEAYVACPGCDCADNVSATVAYGEPRVRAVDTATTMTMRVGFDDQRSYPVCYRVYDSGFAVVEAVVAVTNAPEALQIAPVPTHQGQRLTYNFTTTSTTTSTFTASAQDTAMLVTQRRGCWEPPSTQPDGVLASGSVTLRDGVVQWETHVPSLGPHTPATTLFPLTYVICYRASSQSEYVPVPFPSLGAFMTAPDPARVAATTPSVLTQGMVDASVRFANAVRGDTAYAVRVWTATLQTDRACDAQDGSGVTRLSADADAYPNLILSIPGDVAVGSGAVVLCYTHVGATVAEVPESVTIAQGNPSTYTVNAFPRARQYLSVRLRGTNLSPTEGDAIVFVNTPCAAATRPPRSTSDLARLGDLAGNATEVQVVAQFVPATVPRTVYVCYYRAAIDRWSEVGAPFTLDTAQPIRVTVLGDRPGMTPRVGQHVALILDGLAATTTLRAAAVLRGTTTGSGTWCHNFTDDAVQEPTLRVTSGLRLDVGVWQSTEPVRLCVAVQDATTPPWSDVAANATAATLPSLLPANPANWTVYPATPRVGQQVTLTFHHLIDATDADVVRVAMGRDGGCEDAIAVVGFDTDLAVDLVDSRTTQLTLTDRTDSMLYRSFNTSGEYRLCYYAANEKVWSTVGESLSIATAAPQTWELASGTLQVGSPFTLRFTDNTAGLSSTLDSAWLVPETLSCGVDPTTCSRCLVFQLDPTTSTATVTTTRANASFAAGTYGVCYRLYNATAAVLPTPLRMELGPIECVVNATMTIGAPGTVFFRTRTGEDVTGDAWRASAFASHADHCEERYLPAFPAARAVQVGSNATTVSYHLEWPVSLRDGRYTVCYTHRGVTGAVCTCDQVADGLGDCFVETRSGTPQNFTATPHPTYVGQSVELDVRLNATTAGAVVSEMALVEYEDVLTTCADAAVTVLDARLERVSSVQYRYTFRYPYDAVPRALLVCARTTATADWSRVGSPSTSDLLTLRPYFVLDTVPAPGAYLRALQTTNLTFTLTSTADDDVVDAQDSLTFVPTAADCVADYINAQDPATVMADFVRDDGAFVTLPTRVSGVAPEARRTTSVVTFRTAGDYVVCYRLAAGTWAPVMPGLTILPALVEDCAFATPVSARNGADASPRAMQFIFTNLTVTSAMSGLYSSADVTRTVRDGAACTDDAAELYRAEVRVGPTGTLLQTQTFAPIAGAVKVCYRLGGPSSTFSNWSPICPTALTLAAASPLGRTRGCLGVGFSLDTVVTHRDGFVFTADDRFRVVAGAAPCVEVNGSASVLRTVTVGDAAQTVDGVGVDTGAVGTGRATLPYWLLGTGTKAIRLCYRDAGGNAFAIALDAEVAPSQSAVSVQPRQPTTVHTGQSVLQLGQRLRLNFSAAEDAVVPLTAYAPAPTPLRPGPVFDGTTDAAALQRLADGTAYRDGRCTAAQRANAAAFNATLHDVYGPPDPVTNLPYTLAVDAPSATGVVVVCYALPRCGVVDVGDPLRIAPANPTRVVPDVDPPRRGQRVRVRFYAAAAAVLRPGRDVAAVVADLDTCWLLADDDGVVVDGDAAVTSTTVFFPAQAPSVAVASTPTRACYAVDGGSWAEVPSGGVNVVLAANPKAARTTPSPARVDQRNTLILDGSGLGTEDVVKLVEDSDDCDAAPPPTLVARVSGTAVTGSAAGWRVSAVSADATTTTFAFSSNVTGSYAVCYRLARDGVWTRVYGTVTVAARDPASVTMSPVSALEGELFTLTFVAAAGDLTGRDRLTLYFGADVNCLAAGDAPAMTTAASRTDGLPNSLAFQLAAGTRGTYTVCYQRATSTAGVYNPVWGFASVLIAPNPDDWLVASPTPSRAQQLVALDFAGFGLVNSTTHGDAVRLVRTADVSGTDAETACRTNAFPVTDVVLYPLRANGTNAIQTLRRDATAASAGAVYYVCYKLDGGQFHVLSGTLALTAAAAPAGVTGARLGGVVYDGEVVAWEVRWDDAGECASEDVLFYSAVGCDDVPYYVLDPDLDAWPLGATHVNCTTGATTTLPLRTWSGFDDVEVALCYAAGGATSMLAAHAFRAQLGQPPVRSDSIVVQPQHLFNFNLAVVPTVRDYVVLLTDPNRCGGVTAPVNEAVLTEMDVEDDGVHVRAMVGSAGDYYVCYSHQGGGNCAPRAGQECARVVAHVVARAQPPLQWSPTTPQPSYITEEVAVSVYDESDHDTGVTAVWLAQMTTGDERVTYTMADVATRCLDTSSSSSTAMRTIPLVQNTTTGYWASAGTVNESGHYALCATVGSDLVLFPPLEQSGPVVWPGVVTAVDLAEDAQVGHTTTVLLRGGGLTGEDVLVAVVASASRNVCDDVADDVVVSPTTTGLGLRVSPRTLLFTVAGDYVLCYTPLHGRRARLPGLVVTVSPSVVDVERVGGAPFVNVPLRLRLRGAGLSANNVAALALWPSDAASRGASVAELCDGLDYDAVDNVSTDGTVAYFTTRAREMGEHVVCYRTTPTTDAVVLPSRLNITQRRAVAVGFAREPAGCAVNAACAVQPVLQLRDVDGAVAADPGAVLSLRLSYPSGSPAPDTDLDHGDDYVVTGDATFTLRALLIRDVGDFYLVATVQLVGDVTLQARSDLITVTDTPPPARVIATLECSPDDYVRDDSRTIACQVRSDTADATFDVEVNAGQVGECVAESSASDRECAFTVTTPDPSTMVNYVRIRVTPRTPYTSWVVQNSPLDVRLPRRPDTNTWLGCARTENATRDDPMPAADLVRVNDELNCSVQGRLAHDGVVDDVVALARYLRLRARYDAGTATTITLPDYPNDVNGRYVVLYRVANDGRNLSLLGDVADSTTTMTWAAMTGSPRSFTLVATPTAGATRVQCDADTTTSTRYFALGEGFTCTLDAADAAGPVTVLARDLQLTMTAGGTVRSPSMEYGEVLHFNGTAPTTSPVQRVVALADESRVFALEVYHVPSATTLARYDGVLLYARLVDDGAGLVRGTTARLVLTGSGLDPSHRYAFSPYVSCSNDTTLYTATATSGPEPDELTLRLLVPPVAVLYLCVQPMDAPDGALQLLLPQRFVVTDPTPSSSGGWTGDDIALLVVGVVFLAVLLLLLFVLLWCLCCGDDAQETTTTLLTTPAPAVVYMPPRPNDRFLYRGEVAPAPRDVVDTTTINLALPNAASTQTQQTVIPPPQPIHTVPLPLPPHHDPVPTTSYTSGDTYRTSDTAPHRHRHRRRKHRTSSSSGVADERAGRQLSAADAIVARLGPHAGRVLDAPPSHIPAAPPAQTQTPLYLTLLEQKSGGSRTPSSGPYQHLHQFAHAANSEQRTDNAVRQSNQHLPPLAPTPSDRATSSTPTPPQEGVLVGPLVVQGHTSQPMLRSRPTSQTNQSESKSANSHDTSARPLS